jgi:hypothetical protein
MKSSQLCMNIGGAAKHIPHFCHLCQKHSDVIASPNQIPCGACSQCPGGVVYHQYPMMDNAVLPNLRVRK